MTRATIRKLCDDTALFGTPDDIARKLEALRAGGVEYVMINFGGSRENIRRFARDIMPAFAGEPAVAAAARRNSRCPSPALPGIHGFQFTTRHGELWHADRDLRVSVPPWF